MAQEFDVYALDILLLMALFYWQVCRLTSPRDPNKKGEANGAEGLLPRHAPADPAAGGGWDGPPPQGAAEPDLPALRGLADIRLGDPDFDAGHFLAGVRAVYEPIVTAFDSGDREMLAELSSDEVYGAFAAAIEAREGRGERVETSFVRIEPPEIVHAGLGPDGAEIAVRCVSQLVSATYAPQGEVVAGDPRAVRTVTDIWTFARELGPPRAAWTLVATAPDA